MENFDDAMLTRWLFNVIREAVFHEAAEWFRVDGVGEKIERWMR